MSALLTVEELNAWYGRAHILRGVDLTDSLAKSEGIGVLFTEHDMDVVFGHADRVLVLVRGEIIATGSPEAVRADARGRQAYLGDEHALRAAP